MGGGRCAEHTAISPPAHPALAQQATPSSLQRSPRARLYLHSSPRSPRRPLAVSPLAFLQDDVFDRLHINASSSFILKNTEKVELDDAAPFYVGVAPPNVARDM